MVIRDVVIVAALLGGAVGGVAAEVISVQELKDIASGYQSAIITVMRSDMMLGIDPKRDYMAIQVDAQGRVYCSPELAPDEKVRVVPLGK